MSLKTDKYFVISTQTQSNNFKGRKVDYTELTDHPEYAQLCEMQLSNTLADKFPRDDNRIRHDATNYHTPKMMKETPARYSTDEDGFMFIEDEAEAKKVLDILQKTDADIHLSKYGKQFTVPKGSKK